MINFPPQSHLFLIIIFNNDAYNFRTNAITGCNVGSNRSHVVYVFTMNQKNKKPAVFHLVELAGSEKRYHRFFHYSLFYCATVIILFCILLN